MLIRDIMTHHPVRISPSATLRRAAEIISIAEVSDVMVDGVLGPDLDRLWNLTIALVSPREPALRVRRDGHSPPSASSR